MDQKTSSRCKAVTVSHFSHPLMCVLYVLPAAMNMNDQVHNIHQTSNWMQRQIGVWVCRRKEKSFVICCCKKSTLVIHSHLHCVTWVLTFGQTLQHDENRCLHPSILILLCRIAKRNTSAILDMKLNLFSMLSHMAWCQSAKESGYLIYLLTVETEVWSRLVGVHPKLNYNPYLAFNAWCASGCWFAWVIN